MSTEIVEYSKTESALAGLRERYSVSVWVVDTHEKMMLAKKARAEIREWRLSLESERKRIKAPALERCKSIDAEAKRITEELEKLEEPVDSAIKTEENRQKQEKEREARAEESRIAEAQKQISGIRENAVIMVGRPSKEIESVIDALDSRDVSRTDEFASVAIIAKTETIAKLHELHTAACAHEAEQAKVAAERAELARLRAEQETRHAEEERKRLAVEAESKAKIEAEQKAARDRIVEEERQARIAREKADSEARALRAKAEEETARERAKVQAELDRIEAEKRAAREAVESVEREKRRQANELLDAREMIKAFISRFGSLKEFSAVTEAIRSYLGTIRQEPVRQRPDARFRCSRVGTSDGERARCVRNGG